MNHRPKPAPIVLVLVSLLASGCGSLFGASPGATEVEEEPPPPEEPERAVVCTEIASGLAGLWTDARGRGVLSLAVRDQRDVGLFLDTDGTFWLSEPGWTIEIGEWGSCSGDTAELATTEHITGEGGGSIDGEILGVVCRARDLLPPRRRELSLAPCAAPDGSDGPCLQLEGMVLFPSTATAGLDVDEIRPLCNRGEEPEEPASD